MKKKKIGLFVCASLFALSAFSQEKALKQYGFGDNWFIQGQVGAEYTFSEYNRKTSVGDLITPHVAVSVGKFFSPQLGARLQLGGWQAKSYVEPTDHTFKINYFQVNADGLLNLTNLFTPYKGDKTFNLYAIAGLGYVHGFKKSEDALTTNNMIAPRGGFQADFRVNDDLSLNLEAVGNLLRDDFNGRTEGLKYDGTLNIMAGITYRFNKNGFELVEPLDPLQIQSLNDQINEQRAALTDKDRQINDYKTMLAQKPEPQVIIKETTEVNEEVLMNAVVVFRLGSANLEQNQDINIFNAAKYLQDNPSVNIVLTGYADKSTGSKEVNQRLSEKRAKTVSDVLINKYNISPSRITTKASGDSEQPFPTDSWNRVVTFTARR